MAVSLWLALGLCLAGCTYVTPRQPMSIHELRTLGMSRQAHEFTCGAAALATLLTALGKPTSESEVLQVIFSDTTRYHVNAAGQMEIHPLSAADLEKVARQEGFRAVTMQAATAGDALAALSKLQPIICRVQLYKEFLHFVVIQGAENGWVYMSDPAYGHVRVPVSHFDRVWEEGDRVILAVSRKPFLAWKNDAGQLFLRRDESETVARIAEIAPISLYTSSLQSVTFSNALPK